jgi:hypothetical protein
MTSVIIVPGNGPYADAPEATMALAHARKLRGLGRGFCLSPAGEDGWVAVTGRSAGLAVLEVAGPLPAKLPPPPPTWTVIMPGLGIAQHWYCPPLTGDGELTPGQHKPSGVTIIRHAPLPGTPHPSGARWVWGEVHPWNLPEPAVLPLDWWRALPVSLPDKLDQRPTISLYRRNTYK